MSKTFICRHCKRRIHVNPRIKGRQRYCGKVGCQQARKNTWERNANANDGVYRAKRKQIKTQWRKTRSAYQYQRDYRASHPEYVKKNREKQRLRNQNRNVSVCKEQIVKTDALNSQSLIRTGYYALFPCKNAQGKKIVKTDALIVQIAGIREKASCLLQNTT